MLDAAVLTWTAQRIHEGAAHSIPSPPEQIDGQDLAIWV
jgi:predicted RNase H-like nuclease